MHILGKKTASHQVNPPGDRQRARKAVAGRARSSYGLSYNLDAGRQSRLYASASWNAGMVAIPRRHAIRYNKARLD